MFSSQTILAGLVVILAGLAMARSAEFESVDAVLWTDRLVVLKVDGTFAVWKASTGVADKRGADA